MDLEKSFPAIAAAAGLAAAAYFVSQSLSTDESSMIGGGGGWSVSPPPPPREAGAGASATKKGTAATEETQPSITINYPKESDITLTPPESFYQPPQPPQEQHDGISRSGTYHFRTPTPYRPKKITAEEARKYTESLSTHEYIRSFYAGGWARGGGSTSTIRTKKSTPSVDIPRTTTSTVKAAPGTGTGRETAAMRAPTPSGRITTVGPTGKAIGISISAPKSKKTTTRRSIFSRVRSFFRRIA